MADVKLKSIDLDSDDEQTDATVTFMFFHGKGSLEIEVEIEDVDSLDEARDKALKELRQMGHDLSSAADAALRR